MDIEWNELGRGSRRKEDVREERTDRQTDRQARRETGKKGDRKETGKLSPVIASRTWTLSGTSSGVEVAGRRTSERKGHEGGRQEEQTGEEIAGTKRIRKPAGTAGKRERKGQERKRGKRGADFPIVRRESIWSKRKEGECKGKEGDAEE